MSLLTRTFIACLCLASLKRRNGHSAMAATIVVPASIEHIGGDREDGPILASSRFFMNAAGWDVVGGLGVKGPEICHKSLCYEDSGPSSWHWRAPENFIVNLSSAFGGILVVDRGFFEFNRAGKDGSEPASTDFDIEIESHKHGMVIGVPNLVTPGLFSMKHEVAFGEEGGWLLANGARATTQDIRKVLSAAANLFIRGGHYAGPEHAYISKVVLKGPRPPASATQNKPGVASSSETGKLLPESVMAHGKKEEEGALQKALRERDSAAQVSPQVVIHVDRKQEVSADVAVTSMPSNSKATTGVHWQQQQLQQQQQLLHSNELPCMDDGTGLPVARLVESARISQTTLYACLSSRQGAFSVSSDTLSYQPAGLSATPDTVRLSMVYSVAVDDEGHVAITGLNKEVLVKGCKMDAFDIDQVATFFEVVQDLVTAARS